MSSGLSPESSSICMKDLLAVSARSYSVAHEIPYVYVSINGLSGKANELYIKLEKLTTTPSTAWTDLFKQGTIRNYYDSTAPWPVVIPNKLISADRNKFTIVVTPEDERTANAHLISHWIKYDPTLATHNRPGQYKLTFKDSRAFNAFNIKPKVCDDLAHCTDVSIINVNKNVHSPDERPSPPPSTWVYSFVMNEIPDTKYIKFMFEIEYTAHELIPGVLEAQIELITFGDPCQVPATECENVGRARGKKCMNEAVSSAPNVCPCLFGYSGDRCEKVDYCMLGKSGQVICDNSVASKTCDNEGSTHLVGDMGDKNKVYRCVCQDPAHFNAVNWDKTAKMCREAAIKLVRGWTQVGTDFYPSDSSNEISYEFTDISTDRVDICSTIDYTLVNPTHSITVNYQVGVSVRKLVDLNLLQGSNVVKFCVRDFMYKPSSNFFLTITSVADKYDASSLIKFTWSVESVLIGTMNMKLIAGLKATDRWRNDYLFGDNAFTFDGTKFKNTITIPPKTTTEIPIYLMSDWIEFNPKINDPLKPRISIDKILAANINAVKIETGILWDTQDMSSLQLSRVAFLADKDIEQSLQITQYNKIQYFKLVMKFTLTNADATNPKTVDLAVSDVSIGDPCDRRARNVCSNQGTCSSLVAPIQYSPENYVCTCDDAHFGKDCELKRCADVDAREMCNALPRYALDIANPYSDVAVYMVSKWVQKTTDLVDVWIKLTSKDFTGFAIQFVTFDDKLQEASAVDTVIGDNKIIQNAVTTTNNKLKIKVPAGRVWKFGIRVTYITIYKELFTIDQFSLNDPCAEPDKHSLINCATRDSHGVCKRFVKEHPELPYYCECDRRLYYGDKCERTNYCTNPYIHFPNKKGDDYCASDAKRGKCEIDPSNNQFECTCPKVEQYYWDSRDDVMDCKNLPKCFTKGCNKVSENCVEPPEDTPENDATCVAKEGYYKDPVTGVTTRIDICKVADRKIAKYLNEKPCDDDRAICEHDFISLTHYTCRCPPGNRITLQVP
ncbi:unnamed protein product [Medioppia subpectinata]|uniref:EGF-like domain-containing protein n=1 Tax=Medioppia subpectinata TaxID=1979941 RepID=A0A7R9Q045_9ACAR|nr:unnamed protein product [Medioppia subpectinata]CAG2107704.1 unnamed protein product [Medioppia subpectinata]